MTGEHPIRGKRGHTTSGDSRVGEAARLLSTRTLRTLLDCSDRCLRRWVAAGKIPPPDLQIGRSLRWKATTVQEFLESAGVDWHGQKKSARPR